MTDFGNDISTFPDLDPTFKLQTGPRIVAEAIARRYITPRGGGLFYAEAYGYDLRALLNGSFNNAELAALATALEQEALEDERVLTASVTVVLTAATHTMTITVAFEAAEGEFELVLSVGQVTTEILRFQ